MAYMYDEGIFEIGLPGYLERDLIAFKKGISDKVTYIDCLVNELQGSVDSAFVDGDISEKQRDYFYKKYINSKWW